MIKESLSPRRRGDAEKTDGKDRRDRAPSPTSRGIGKGKTRQKEAYRGFAQMVADQEKEKSTGKSAGATKIKKNEHKQGELPTINGANQPRGPRHGLTN